MDNTFFINLLSLQKEWLKPRKHETVIEYEKRIKYPYDLSFYFHPLGATNG